MAESPSDRKGRPSSGKWRKFTSDPAVRSALIAFAASRIFLTLWAVIVLIFQPQPETPDEVLRPYLGQPRLTEGVVGALLGPWQRFDTLHYMRIAETGYETPEDSVFPPLYPYASAGIGWLFSPVLPQAERNLLGSVLLSNAAFFGVLVLLYRLTAREQDNRSALRSIVYLTIFPTSFFLLAAYSESLFIFFSIGSILASRRRQYLLAGSLGFFASLTRLTGVVLFIPLVYEYLSHKEFNVKLIDRRSIPLLLPLVGTAGFLLWRSTAGLPVLAEIYEQFWYQTTGIPGADLVRAIVRMIEGKSTFTLIFDFLCALLLIVTTVEVFRKLGPTFGLYSAGLLLFMLLPTSDLKPLYSFSRYTLAFFPTFMLMGQFGSTPWRNRVIVYPSVALLLYFSGQFFMWGWVA